ncbi:hypothetical protein C9374_004831 [Naegleria lovaniensis]|uniref:Uncharacterized protein n=1 Tax=Naegleria lovaniensis TaxID=51637 RepID=A0AA88KII9_NAELO|nr:uncharacterized protein C9374_004831 [Naegleria lovaniensis]KAG2382864.1 hypothetical protein C9374_004831 [Naegleria lovaniensis]
MGTQDGTQQVIIELSDMIVTDPSHTDDNYYKNLIDKFNCEMRRSCCRKRKQSSPMGFEMQFQLVHKFGTGRNGNSQQELHSPTDIAISYHHSCILINDQQNRRIQLFDLVTKQFKISLLQPLGKHSLTIALQENYNNFDQDALLIGCSKHIQKHDLQILVRRGGNRVCLDALLWEAKENLQQYDMRGLAVKYSFTNSLIFAACVNPFSDLSSQIAILDATTGQCMQTFAFGKSPRGMCFSPRHDLLLVCSTHESTILIFQVTLNSGTNEEKWEQISQFGKWGHHEGEFHHPRSIVFNAKFGHWIVSDWLNGRVQIFNEKGCFVKSYGKYGDLDNQFNGPSGVCLDEETGELYICDGGNDRVLVFK